MSQYLYDEALVDKIRNWTRNSDIHVYGPDETERMFGVNADLVDDKPLELPLITISRDRGFLINPGGNTRRPLSYDGLTLFANKEKSKILNAIPISLDYYINIYTRYQKESDILARNIIFNIVNQPALTVVVPDTDNFDGKTCDEYGIPYEPLQHTARIEMGHNQVQDRSNIKERFIEGNFTRLTLLITLTDAYLWDVREHFNAEIEFDIDTKFEAMHLIYKSDVGTPPPARYFTSLEHVMASYDLPYMLEDGYEWLGWCYDEEHTKPARPGDIMTDNTILYAHFRKLTED